MKMPVVLLPAVLVLFGAAAAAHAQSGTITFNGRVTSTTCEVSFNGVIGNDPQIRLPTVSAASLKAGQSAGRTPVNVHIEGDDPVCMEGGVRVQLNPANRSRLRNGRLANEALAVDGTNAVVGLRDANDTLINLATAWTSPVRNPGGNGSDISFFAEYYADGADAIAGVFQAPLEYTLLYP